MSPSKRKTRVAWLIALLLLLLAWGVVTQPFVTPHAFTPPAVDAARLEAHVRMLSQTHYPRSFDQPEKLEAVADYIHLQFAQTGARVEDQYYEVEGARVRNVVARFGPADGPLLVIGAHYDSHGAAVEGAKNPKGFSPETHTPGADDNASGVAGLLELARLLAASPPARSVELVAYTLEEPPHFRTANMGSAQHAAGLHAAKRNVTLMIALEMIGTFSDAAGSQRYPIPGMGLLYPTQGNFIAIIGRLRDGLATRRLKATMAGVTDLPVYSMNAPRILQGIDFSDHLSYWHEGFSALMVTDTAFQRNDQYHQAGDTADKLDYERMAKVVQAVFAATR